MATAAEFGAWASPITGDLITSGARGIADLQLDASDKAERIFWCEVRPSEGGRGVVCSQAKGGDVISWTPSGFGARTKVHEYGGGSFCAGDGAVFFTNAEDQRVHRQATPNDAPVPLTPADKGLRYADMTYSNGRVFAVEEDHSKVAKEGDYPVNTLVSIHTTEPGTPTKIATGADFYYSPRLSGDGKRITWLQWLSPNMPWESTEIWVGDVSGTGEVSGAKKVLGDGKTSFIMPRLGPKSLFVSHDKSDWWNVYEVDQATGVEHRNVYPVESEIGEPLWQFGYQSYAVNSDGSQIAFFLKSDLMLLDLDKDPQAARKIKTGYSGHRFVQFSSGGFVYALASAPSLASAVVRVDVASGATEVVRAAADSTPDEAFLSQPREVAFPTGKDKAATAYANFYEPRNPNFVGLPDTKPPLVIMAHGGPTGQASPAMDLKKQFYTSRGFAVMDVNYRGSTGYGRLFRDSLRGEMGVYDIEDCCEAARFAAQQGWADPKRLCIEGGSSGGYVVLCAISVPKLFSAAVSRYGISDLEALCASTHKFEASYNDFLLAPYPEGAEIYRQRSPIHHIDDIVCPVAFFQGLDDKVVPPDQTTKMFQAVKAKGLPTALVEFKGEGHGFRAAENIKLSLEGTYVYYCKVLGIKSDISIPTEKAS